MKTNKGSRFALALFAAGFVAAAPSFAQDVPAGVVMFTPEKAKWAPGRLVPELQSAPVFGDQQKPGAYLGMSKFPPNFKIQPHTHPDERHYTVISGTWYVGFGSKWDDSKLIALPAGSYYTEPANTPHFIATKADGAVVHIGGKAPTGITYMDPAKK
jgi:quercetin dioxygenase-like cupin family protein